MYSIKRKAEIISYLEQSGSVDVNFLSSQFATSKETVRRDLRELEREGILQRTHGGAVLKAQSAHNNAEYSVVVRGIQRYSEKEEICSKAAAFIHEGDIIFVDNSSTTMYLAQFIPADLNITILTNSIKFLVESAKHPSPNHQLICLGGMFHTNNLSVYGNTTQKSAQEYYPNKSFISCAGITSQTMLTDSSIYEIDTKRMMIDRAQEVFVLADYTKFLNSSQIFLANFLSVDYIITDSTTDRAALDYLNHTNIKLI